MEKETSPKSQIFGAIKAFWSTMRRSGGTSFEIGSEENKKRRKEKMEHLVSLLEGADVSQFEYTRENLRLLESIIHVLQGLPLGVQYTGQTHGEFDDYQKRLKVLRQKIREKVAQSVGLSGEQRGKLSGYWNVINTDDSGIWFMSKVTQEGKISYEDRYVLSAGTLTVSRTSWRSPVHRAAIFGRQTAGPHTTEVIEKRKIESF